MILSELIWPILIYDVEYLGSFNNSQWRSSQVLNKQNINYHGNGRKRWLVTNYGKYSSYLLQGAFFFLKEMEYVNIDGAAEFHTLDVLNGL